MASASVLAGGLIQALRPGGALLAFFGAGRPGEGSYTRYLIEDEAHLRYRFSDAACGRERALQNRDILRLFAGPAAVAARRRASRRVHEAPSIICSPGFASCS
jgi:hypothetical protein